MLNQQGCLESVYQHQRMWYLGMQQREEGIGPILTIPRTQTLHHFSLHPLTLIAHRDDSPVQHHTIEQKKRKL